MDFYDSLLNPTPEPQQTPNTMGANYGYQDQSMMGMGVPYQDQAMMGMEMGVPYQDQSMMGMGVPYQDQPMMGMGMGVPYQDQAMMGYGYPRVNKAMVLQEIQNYVFNMTRVPVAKVIKLDELDNKFRHACVQVGDVSFLDVNYFPVPMLGINVAFYFCTACGNLYIQKDFM